MNRIPQRSGTAFTRRQGHCLRVADPAGEQVSDLVAFSADDTGEFLSSGRTLDLPAACSSQQAIVFTRTPAE